MSLPGSGIISLNAINTELGKSPSAQISLNDSDVRGLLAKASGQISLSDAYGKTKPSVGNTFISGYETTYGLYGWNKDTSTGFAVTGSANPNPIPMAPYSGNMVTILAGNVYGPITVILGTGPASDIIVTINGVQMVFYYYMNSYGYNYYSVYNIVINTSGQNTISFG